MSPEIILQLSGVDLYYDHLHALKGVAIALERGEVVALIGANGAGKSSILGAISGLHPIHSGEIHFQSERIDGLASHEIVKRGITMVQEGRHVFPYMSVKDNLLMGAFLQSDPATIRNLLDGVLERFPRLRERYSQAAGTMSGGEQQMLVIGRALMANPVLLLLDEPLLGIAPKLAQEIMRSIVAINRDKKVSVLLVEENSRMALRVSRRAYAMVTGSVELQGDARDLLEDERLRALYLGGEI